ncbi:MAG: lipoprotein-releasing system permease protein [Rubritalea sp.]|jgi:lipoprotein-releasing system permease protein
MVKNFSLLLALRYLNPIRTHVSVITLISLAGVAIGVMVLIVVLSVMDGFEDLIKTRVLGRAPHITSYVKAWDYEVNPDGTQVTIEDQWRAHMEELKKQPCVENAYPLVEDHVLLEINSGIAASRMRGLDTANEEAMEDFNKLLKEGEPMGEGYNATISSVFAQQSGIMLGDKIEIISNRNLKQLKPLRDQQGYSPLKEQFPEQIEKVITEIKQYLTLSRNPKDEPREAMLNPQAQAIKDQIQVWHNAEIRKGEHEMLEALIKDILNSTEYDPDDANGYNFYPVGTKQSALDLLQEIKTLDIHKMDANAISEIALSKDVIIVGIYQTDPFAPGPDIFAPMLLAQELAGAGDSGAVQGIAITLKDPYQAAEHLKKDLNKIITGNWEGQTWMEHHKQQFSLISSQKTMMTIALSFIILIAVFSIGAVMFTITYQKKREIGVMKALGATPSQVTQVFTFQGVIVGILGAIIGWLLALVVLANLDLIQGGLTAAGFNPFPEDYYGVPTLPHIINPVQIWAVCIGAFILCTLAALVPAWIASRADAAKSLRNM